MTPDLRQCAGPDYLRLKALFRQLVDLAGGPDLASTFTRVERSQIYNYGAAGSDLYAPIDVVLDLEAQVGRPIVTSEVMRLVREHQAAPAVAPASNLDRGAQRITAELGDVARLLADLPEGAIPAALERKAGDLMAAAREFHDDVCQLRATQPKRVA